MKISSSDIQKLRTETGAGIMDAKKALTAAKGDFTKAVEHLRKQGQKIALKKADRTTSEGLVGHYVHSNGKAAGLVALACETDFVARTKEFAALAHDLAMHVVAMDPSYLDAESVPQDVIESEKSVYLEQVVQEGKPKNIQEKIIEGKLKAFYKENCLINQPFIKDDKKSIEDLLKEYVAKLGENIRITKYTYLTL